MTVVYPGYEPDFDPTDADMKAYREARRRAEANSYDGRGWDRLDNSEKVRLIREERERLPTAEVIPFTPSSSPLPIRSEIDL